MRYTRVYLQAWGIVLMLFAVMLVMVMSGKGSMRVFGSSIDLSEYSVYQLYKINDSLAFEVGRGYVSLVSYQRTSGIYALAGDYEHAPNEGKNVFMVSADYLKDDYIYSTFPMGKTTIVNLKSGETVGKLVDSDPLNDPDFKPIDASQLPEYRQRGLVFEDRYKLTPEKVKAEYPVLSTYNERIFIVEMAFFCIFILLVMAGIPILLHTVRRQVNDQNHCKYKD